MIASVFEEAKHYIPGGVNSPVRAFNGVGGVPLFFKSAHGAYLVAENGQEYVDYVGSWGPMILGNAYPDVIKAVGEAIQNGLSFGAPTVLEVQLAKKISELMPNIEQVRMVNSGTEASMSAIRLARGFTNRNKIVKFAGCYHGHADSLLVKAGSGILTLGIPSSAGVPESITHHTLIADFNDLSSVEALFNQYGDDIAGVIIEPVAGNMNCVPGDSDFLKELRNITKQYDSLLIFDEVMTGFRVALGGAQSYYGIKPDLTILGKVIGGGMPVGAFGGRRDIMQYLAPIGPVYQAGTLSGNPIAMTAGLKMLEIISTIPHFHKNLSDQTANLMEGLKERASAACIPFQTHSVGGMFGFFFTEKNPINNFNDVKTTDTTRFKKFFHGMLQEGVYFAPSAFEAGFMSSAHGVHEIEKTLKASERVFKKI